MGNPRKLIVLDKAHLLHKDINKAVESIRKAHVGPLKKQLLKSALSIPSNIAEGRRRTSQRDFLRFLDMALGSTGELDEQLRSANDCNAIPAETCANLIKRNDEIGKMVSGLRRRIIEDTGDDVDT